MSTRAFGKSEERIVQTLLCAPGKSKLPYPATVSMIFLCNAEKCRCTVATAVRTLEGAAEWIQRQVAPTLALLLNAKGYGADFFEAALEQGHQRLKSWQWALLTPVPVVLEN